jgi:Trk-type K+ transport system membrane component
MILLMFIGRIGILSFLLLFITDQGQEKLEIAETHFESDLPLLIR